MFTSTFDVITLWHLCSCRIGSSTSFLLTSLVPSRLVFEVKVVVVVVVVLFVMHSGALHFKLMLVQQ